MSKRKCKRQHDLDLLVIYSNSYWFKSLKIACFASIWSELGSGAVGLEDQRIFSRQNGATAAQHAVNPACLLGSQLLQADPRELRRRWITASQWKQQDGDTDIHE